METVSPHQTSFLWCMYVRGEHRGHPLHQGCLPVSHPPSPVASPAPGQACWSRPSSLRMCRWGGCGLTVKQPIRLCSKGRWKARGSPHQSSSSVAALWKLAGFCKCCGRERRQHEVPGMQTARQQGRPQALGRGDSKARLTRFLQLLLIQFPFALLPQPSPWQDGD